MTVLVQLTWYCVRIEMLVQQVMIFLGISYAMEYCTSIACHAQVLEPSHGAKPPTNRLDYCCISHELLSRVGNLTKVHLNTLQKKKSAEYF